MPAGKTQFFVHEGKLCTGHMSRENKLVDIRPVKYTSLLVDRVFRDGVHLEDNIDLDLETQVDVKGDPPAGLGWCYVPSSRRFRVTGGTVVANVLSTRMESLSFEVDGKPVTVTYEELLEHGVTPRVYSIPLQGDQKTPSQEKEERWQAHRLQKEVADRVFELALEEWPKRWLETYPKKARRFSSAAPEPIPYPWLTGLQKDVFLGSVVGLTEARFEGLLRRSLTKLIQKKAKDKKEALKKSSSDQ